MSEIVSTTSVPITVMPMSERLLTPWTHGLAQPVITLIKLKRKRRTYLFVGCFKKEWWKPRKSQPGSQKKCKKRLLKV
jgi:hypothetical protein